jgi:hypothetical protein
LTASWASAHKVLVVPHPSYDNQKLLHILWHVGVEGRITSAENHSADLITIISVIPVFLPFLCHFH